MASSEGRCSCDQDGVCLCSQTWVLVIHNDFEGIKKFRRQGDDVDLKNLRRVFETQRGCKFRELHNRGSEEIVQTLAQEELLIQLFQPCDQDAPLSCPPAAFILFILSHGESGGVILTDHFKKDTRPDEFKFETYNTKDVWNLAKIDFLASSLKLLFLGPCRGNLVEFKLIDEDRKKKIPTLPGWLSSRPNKENFVILYATIETTMAHRCEADGTWFVEAICKELENLTENLPLLNFLTRIQFQLCAKNTFGDTSIGQTSQLHFFYHQKFTMCASKLIHSTNQTLTLLKKEQTDNIPQRDVASSSMHWSNVTYDAKAGNLGGLVKSFDKRFIYDWLDKKGNQLKRGKALIFHDTRHYVCALKMGLNLKGLGYTTSLHDVFNLNSIITQSWPKKGFKHDGSFIVCVLAQIWQTENGLVIKQANKSYLLSKIIDEYTGTKCTQLIGKPKLFFFLDDGVKSDGQPITGDETTIISSGYKYFNLHAGVCTFVGVRCGPKGSGGDVVENMIQALGSPRLREEGYNMQMALSEVIAKAAEDKNTEDINRIKPQFFSTLPQLVNFPPLKSPYEQEKSNFTCRVVVAAVLTSIMLGLLFILLGYLMRSPIYLLVNVDGSCGVSFKEGDVYEKDAFSLNSTEFSKISNRCSHVWRETYSLDYTIINYVSDSEYRLAMLELEKMKDKRESVQRIIFFGYTFDNILKWIRFSAWFKKNPLYLDAMRSVITKIASNRDSNNIAVLELSHVLKSNELDQISPNLVLNWTNHILNETCYYISKYNFTTLASLETLSSGVQKHFIPLILAKCCQNVDPSAFISAINIVRNNTRIDCSAYEMLFLEMEKQNQLGSVEAFQLRLFSESYDLFPILKEKQKCKNVVEILKLHFNKHIQPSLKIFAKILKRKECGGMSLFFKNYAIYGSFVYQRYIELVFPYVVEMTCNGSWENAATLMKCFRDINDTKATLVGLLSLVKDFKKYDKLASFESLNIFSAIKYFWTDKDSKLSEYKQKILSVAPHWIQEFLFDEKSVCDYLEDQNCTNSVIEDLSFILADFESRNLTKRREILFIDFVLDSSMYTKVLIRRKFYSINDYGQVWRKLEPLKNRIEKFKKEMLTAMVHRFLDKYTTTNDDDDDDAMLLYTYFGPRVLSAYLPALVHEAYSIKGFQSMPRYIQNLELMYQSYSLSLCKGISSLYSAIEKNPKNLETVEAFFLKCFAVFARDSLQHRDTLDCYLVIENVGDYSKKGMDQYEEYFRQNDTKSLQVLFDWQKKFKYSIFEIVRELIQRLRDLNEPFEFKILYLLSNLPSDDYLCLGIHELFHTIYTTTCPKIVKTASCAYIKKKLCNMSQNIIGLNGNNYLLREKCYKVKGFLCI